MFSPGHEKLLWIAEFIEYQLKITKKLESSYTTIKMACAIYIEYFTIAKF